MTIKKIWADRIPNFGSGTATLLAKSNETVHLNVLIERLMSHISISFTFSFAIHSQNGH